MIKALNKPLAVGMALAVVGISAIAVSALAGTGTLRLRERLANLDPQEPIVYYELAEEVAYEQPEDIALARTLYVLSFELARRRDPRTPLGPSVCLALADLSTSAPERRWLRSLARSMADGGGGAVLPLTPSDVDISPQVALTVAQALGDFHNGEYRKAIDAIDKDPAVREVFERETRSLPGGASRIENELRSEPKCRRCRNKRIIRANATTNDYSICPICNGNPGPNLRDPELIDLLRVSSKLLGGTTSTWSAQFILDEGRPLRDIDPDELAPWFRVDPRATRWDETSLQWIRPGVEPIAPDGDGIDDSMDGAEPEEITSP